MSNEVTKKTKYKQVKINFSEKDFNKLDKLALAKNQTKAEFMRNIFKRHIETSNTKLNTNIQPKETNKTSNLRTLFLINNIANNMNQVAKKINIRAKQNNLHQFDLLALKILNEIKQDFNEIKKILNDS